MIQLSCTVLVLYELVKKMILRTFCLPRASVISMIKISKWLIKIKNDRFWDIFAFELTNWFITVNEKTRPWKLERATVQDSQDHRPFYLWQWTRLFINLLKERWRNGIREIPESFTVKSENPFVGGAALSENLSEAETGSQFIGWKRQFQQNSTKMGFKIREQSIIRQNLSNVAGSAVDVTNDLFCCVDLFMKSTSFVHCYWL
jgi:hypothetical protein